MDAEPTADVYDRVAERYETAFLDELDGKPRDRELLDDLAATTRGPVVEVGCGPGQIGAYLRDRGCTVIGLDLSREMAALAAARLDAATVADMRSLPIATGRAGAIVAFYSVIHLHRTDLATTFAELARALASGGRLLVSAHEGKGEVTLTEFIGVPARLDATFYELGELCDGATSAGLAVVHAERRAPYASEGRTTRLYLLAERSRSYR